MRLIDADELKSDILCRADSCCGVCNPYADSTVLESVRTTLESVADSIDDAPTIDAVKVVRCWDCKRYQLLRRKKGLC